MSFQKISDVSYLCPLRSDGDYGINEIQIPNKKQNDRLKICFHEIKITNIRLFQNKLTIAISVINITAR